jgi:hydrogenase maturation factor
MRQLKNGKLSPAEFDRIVSKFAGKNYTGRPFTARRENLTVADHVRLAQKELLGSLLTTASMTGYTPEVSGLAIYRGSLTALAKGLTPSQCTLTAAFPLDYEEKLMRLFVTEAAKAAEETSVKITDINFRRANIDIPEINVTLFGEPAGKQSDEISEELITNQSKNISEETLTNQSKGISEAPDTLILLGSAALEGTLLLRQLESERLEKKYSRQFLNTDEIKKIIYPEKALKALWEKSQYLQPVAEGGVFGALWELSEKLHLGMKVDLKKISVAPLTVEICETLDLSPYSMMGGGAVIAVTNVPEAAVAVCAEAGYEAAVIGVLNKSNDKLIINGDEIRYLEALKMDSLTEYLASKN